MDTKIAPAVNPLRRAPEHNLEAQQSARNQLPWLHFARPRNREPFPGKSWILQAIWNRRHVTSRGSFYGFARPQWYAAPCP
jgi:hypothetical protein